MAPVKSDYISIPDKDGFKEAVRTESEKQGISMACLIRTVMFKYLNGELVEK